MSDKPTIIFDFDGTIADTFTPTMQILASDYRRWGDRFHRCHTINQLRSLTILEIIRTIPGGWWKFVYLFAKAKRYVRQNVDQVRAYPGIVYTLRTLHDHGFQLLIVTSSGREHVRRFLRRLAIDDVFVTVQPTHGLWRKARTLKNVMRRYHLRPDNTFYVGDEIRDVKACHQAGLPIISVSYGFNSAAGLRRFQPDYLVKKPTQILTLLERFAKLPS